MSVSFGGSTKQKPSTSTMTRNVAPPSAEETALMLVNQRVAQAQAAQLERAMQQQQAFEASPLFTQLQGLQGQAAGGLQSAMGGQLLMPGQQEALQKYYQDAIIAPAIAQMTQAAGQAAQRRGMTIADSPIGQPFLNELANYRSQIGGQQAGSALQLSQQNRGMYQDVLNFGNALRGNMDQNRLALAQAQPGSYGFGNQLAQNRIASAPITQTIRGGGATRSPSYSFGLGDTLGAAQTGLNLYMGNPRTGQAGLRSFFE